MYIVAAVIIPALSTKCFISRLPWIHLSRYTASILLKVQSLRLLILWIWIPSIYTFIIQDVYELYYNDVIEHREEIFHMFSFVYLLILLKWRTNDLIYVTRPISSTMLSFPWPEFLLLEISCYLQTYSNQWLLQ